MFGLDGSMRDRLRAPTMRAPMRWRNPLLNSLVRPRMGLNGSAVRCVRFRSPMPKPFAARGWWKAAWLAPCATHWYVRERRVYSSPLRPFLGAYLATFHS
jgi:hypothetical protein